MVDPLKQAQQALHVVAPLVKDIISITRLSEANDARGPVNLSVDSLRRNQLANVLLRLVLSEVEELGKTAHLDAGVILGHDAHVVLDDSLSQILPSLVSLLVGRLAFFGVEDVGAAEMGAKLLGHLGPAHKLVNGEEFEKLGIEGNLGVSCVSENSLEEVVLLVIIRSENDKVDDSLEDLTERTELVWR